MGKFVDLTGIRFVKLTVLEPAESRRKKNGKPRRYWKCMCDCGRLVEVEGYSLTSGHTQSCGCLVIEKASATGRTHGKTNTRLYNVWCGIKERCNCETHPTYKLYGGRGIKMCDEWNDFSAFELWALKNGYDENARRGECTIDRIDNDKGYSPDNCRWVNQKAQMSNVSYNHIVDYNGKTYTVAQLAREIDMDYLKLLGRLNRGVPVERAVLKVDLRQYKN